jgi:hypothetical protein
MNTKYYMHNRPALLAVTLIHDSQLTVPKILHLTVRDKCIINLVLKVNFIPVCDMLESAKTTRIIENIFYLPSDIIYS